MFKPDTPSPKNHPELFALGHYHQAPGRHPTPLPIQPGMEQIELVTYGRGWVKDENGEWIEVTPGSLLWHVEGNETIGRSDFENPYHCLSVRFRLNGLPRIRAWPQISRWDDVEAVRRFTNEMVACHAMGSASPETVLAYVMARVQLQIELFHRRQPQRTIPHPLQRVLQHIERSYGDNLTLKTLADVAEWSIPQLHKSFREHLGKSPHQWLLNRRVEVARERLANTNHPIKSIAIDCGFYSAAAFCAHFKRASGMTPNVYRKKMTHS